ncbi:MAG: deoxynucleotide monophosphate kinase [Rubrivivax sp.]|jgi:hypothetical protein|nr:deoxynucleotide monophosphate kinase [Rubrivivax sp.]
MQTTHHLPPLIGLMGPAGAGKTTVANMLRERHGYMVISLADPLRDMLGALLSGLGVGHEWMEDRELKERPIPIIGASYRKLAQTLGTEWGRQRIDPALWVRLCAHKIQELRGTHQEAVVVHDVRFPNEAGMIRQAGGWVVRVNRQVDALPDGRSAHPSEQWQATAPADFLILNSGSLELLEDQVYRTAVKVQLADRNRQSQAA